MTTISQDCQDRLGTKIRKLETDCHFLTESPDEEPCNKREAIAAVDDILQTISVKLAVLPLADSGVCCRNIVLASSPSVLATLALARTALRCNLGPTRREVVRV